MPRPARLVAALALSLSGTVLAVSPVAHAQAPETTVRVVDNAYDPRAVTVVVGTTVRWVWAGANLHTVSARDGSFRSQTQTQGDFSQTFRTPGFVDYFCEIHGMSGSVTVQSSPPPSSPSPAASSARPTPSPTTARPSTPPPPSPTAAPSASTPAPLPSPTTASPSPSPTPAATTTAPAPVTPSASPGRSVVPPSTSPTPLALVSLDEPSPQDRTGLAIALGLLVGGAGLGVGGTLLLRGRLGRTRVDGPQVS